MFAQVRTRPVATVGLVVLAAAMAGCSHDGERTSGQPGASGTGSEHGASRPRPGTTSCTAVRYVGDSISVGLVSPQQIPNPGERLEARLHDVGVRAVSVDVSGGRATYEPFMNRPTTLDALPKSSAGYDGCYLLAIGTNDAGNIGAGADRPARQRIDAVMKVVGDRPVLWPLLVSTRQSTPYANANMQRYDAELRRATSRYPNLRLYDWPDERDPAWTEGDGIHDTRRGSRSRALMYAKALAAAFPAGGAPSRDVVVGSVAGRAPSSTNRVNLPAAPGDASAHWAGDTAALTHYTSGARMR